MAINNINGVRLYYTDEDILILYRDSRDKIREIKILAQLNDCSTKDILGVLKRAGVKNIPYKEFSNHREYRGIRWKYDTELSALLGKNRCYVYNHLVKGETYEEIIDRALNKKKRKK